MIRKAYKPLNPLHGVESISLVYMPIRDSNIRIHYMELKARGAGGARFKAWYNENPLHGVESVSMILAIPTSPPANPLHGVESP